MTFQYFRHVLVAGFVLGFLSPLAARANTPEQIFVQVSPSVVVVDIFDAKGKSIGQGSGVVIGKGQVITNCHVAQKGNSLQVRQSASTTSTEVKTSTPSLVEFLEKARPLNPGISDADLTQYWNRTYNQALSSITFKATLQYADSDRDLCQLSVPDLQAQPVVMGTASKLRVGQRVYAIGAPKGLERTLSEGLISSLRPYEGSQYIQTSAAISPGSSGGGLFDDQGRLVGITTFQFIEGQNLNFALPVDWIGELPKRSQAAPTSAKKSRLDWFNRAIALERKQDWLEMSRLSQEWVKSEPESVDAWRMLGSSYFYLKQYEDAIQAYQEALRIQPEYFRYYSTWTHLGIAYSFLKQYDQAIQAYRQALHIQPEDFSTWHNLGNAYDDLKQYDQAIQAYREVLRIEPSFFHAWFSLGNAYFKLKQYDPAIQAYLEALRIQPEDASAWYNLGMAYYFQSQRDKVREIYQTLRKLDPEMAKQYFNDFILP